MNPLLSKLLIDQIDKSKLSVDEAGSVVGLDEQYTSLADTYKELLKPVQPQVQEQEQTPTTPTPRAGGVPTGGSPGTTESLENLNYEDYCKVREKQEKGNYLTDVRKSAIVNYAELLKNSIKLNEAVRNNKKADVYFGEFYLGEVPYIVRSVVLDRNLVESKLYALSAQPTSSTKKEAGV